MYDVSEMKYGAGYEFKKDDFTRFLNLSKMDEKDLFKEAGECCVVNIHQDNIMIGRFMLFCYGSDDNNIFNDTEYSDVGYYTFIEEDLSKLINGNELENIRFKNKSLGVLNQVFKKIINIDELRELTFYELPFEESINMYLEPVVN